MANPNQHPPWVPMRVQPHMKMWPTDWRHYCSAGVGAGGVSASKRIAFNYFNIWPTQLTRSLVMMMTMINVAPILNDDDDEKWDDNDECGNNKKAVRGLKQASTPPPPHHCGFLISLGVLCSSSPLFMAMMFLFDNPTKILPFKVLCKSLLHM